MYSEIHMYADDTTIYVSAPSPDMVAALLNDTLNKFYTWCCRNRILPHPGKTECMILMRGRFIGPMQAIKIGDNVVNQVKSTRCLGVELDNELKVTPNLRGCLPEKNSYARCFLGNHHKLYINKKDIKCRIRQNYKLL